MAQSNSPNIVTNGLVFAYDIDNQKSYKGPPLRNHINTIAPLTTSGTGIIMTNGSEVVDIPTLGQTNVSFVNYQNINSGGNYCCTSFMNYGNAGNIFSGSTLYTYLILYRTDSGYTHPNWMYRYEYNSSGTYQTESGVHDNSRRTYLGNGWYYAWGTFTTQPATTNLQCYSFTYNYSSFNDKISVAKVCILPGNYSGLHPKFWPDTNTTRSTTQAIFDNTNNNTITATSLTYASDGPFRFAGSGQRLDTNLTTFGNNATWEAWINGTSDVSTYNMFMGRYLPYFGFYGANSLYFSNLIGGAQQTIQTATNLTTNTWYHAVFTTSYNGTNTTMKIYTNGIETATGTFSGAQGLDGAYNFAIGDGYNASWYRFDGRVGSTKVYNRTLTASEVLQNFNALRGRYGL
jgi:hypothetical protein